MISRDGPSGGGKPKPTTTKRKASVKSNPMVKNTTLPSSKTIEMPSSKASTSISEWRKQNEQTPVALVQQFKSSAQVHGPTSEDEVRRREQFRQDLLDAFVDIIPLATAIASASGLPQARPAGRIWKFATVIGRKYYGRAVKRY